MATPGRQTLSYLKRRFEQSGIRLRTQLGQNFLIDLNLLEVLLDAAKLGPNDVVLEVGTGTGSLTARMAERAAAVVTIEVDRQMSQLASEELIDCPNVVMLQADALRGKNRLNPEVLEAINQQLAASPGRQWKLVANLPYNIATPLLTNLLDLDSPPVSMTVTIQKELADRVTARPGSKDYSALSVWIQSQCQAEILRTLPPEAFWPRPKVSSAFIHLVVDQTLRERISDRAFFHTFVRAMFFHRRKFLRSELLSAVKDRLDKSQVDRFLAGQQLDPKARAEELSVTAFVQLADAVRTMAAD